MIDPTSFGDWLRLKRKSFDLTREGLADRVGYSAATIRKLEAEERRPSLQLIEQLADIFNINGEERAAFHRFARGDWQAVPPKTGEIAPWRVSTYSPRSNLPAPTSSLIGREKELLAVREYLLSDEIRLLTLIGPPGIGKTRLSIEAARDALPDFRDGVFFVALAPLDDPSLIAPAIVQSLGFVENGEPVPLKRLVDGIGDKQMLLVLDNLEHIIEGIAPLVHELLTRCPLLHILTTSREALHIPGEWLFDVSVLKYPQDAATINTQTASEFSALTLFAERARAVRTEFVLDKSNIRPVASICAQLDGLPLAIELIAPRIRMMSPESLQAWLGDQSFLSADGMRAVPPRQKTLENAIEWSYNLLSADERDLFAGLSVFSGSFTLHAAETIYSRTVTRGSIADLVASLLNKSIIQRDPGASDEARYKMLVTIQQFAREQLRHRGGEAQARDWHLAYFLDLARQADKEIHGPAQVEWIRRVELEQDNFRAALDWGISSRQTELSLRLLNSLLEVWIGRYHRSEIQSRIDTLLGLPEIHSYPELYARLLNHMGLLRWHSGDFSAARAILKEAQEIWSGLGVKGAKGLAECLRLQGLVACFMQEEDPEIVRSLLAESLNLYETQGDLWGKARTYFLFGALAQRQNKYTEAFSASEKSMDLLRRLGDSWSIARVSQILGECYLKQGNHEKARLYFEQHLALDEELSFKHGIIVALENLGDLYRYQGIYEQAQHFYERSLWIGRNYDFPSYGYNLYALGMLALHREDYLSAKVFFHDYYISSRGVAELEVTSEFLTGWAAIAAATNEPERAARLSGAAVALSHTLNRPIPSFDQAEFDRHLRIARRQLGEIAFQALQSEGQAMTSTQAVDYAIGVTSDSSAHSRSL